jgi:hypothetical protein
LEVAGLYKVQAQEAVQEIIQFFQVLLQLAAVVAQRATSQLMAVMAVQVVALQYLALRVQVLPAKVITVVWVLLGRVALPNLDKVAAAVREALAVTVLPLEAVMAARLRHLLFLAVQCLTLVAVVVRATRYLALRVPTQVKALQLPLLLPLQQPIEAVVGVVVILTTMQVLAVPVS